MFSIKNNQKVILRQPKIYSPPKDQKTYKIPKIFIAFIFLIILIVVGFIVAMFTPLFKIKTIETTGNLPEGAQSYLDQIKGNNIFLVKSDQVANVLKTKYPEYLNVDVYKGIPNVLRVQFDERDAKFIWRTKDQYYLTDSNGLSYKNINSDSVGDLVQVIDKNNINITLPSQVATTNFTNFIINVMLKTKDTGFSIKQFEVNDTIFQIDALTSAGFKIKFDITRSLTDQMDALALVYPSKKDNIKQYVDLRVEGKIYYQ